MLQYKGWTDKQAYTLDLTSDYRDGNIIVIIECDNILHAVIKYIICGYGRFDYEILHNYANISKVDIETMLEQLTKQVEVA